MKRRTNSAAAVRAAARAGITFENLELRRLLNGYSLESTITDTDGGYGYATFGRALAVSGNLALIGSPGETGSISLDGGNTYQDFDTSFGKVSLVDTSTGQVLHSFQNPVVNPVPNSEFGTSVAFVGGKIAIGAPGANSVYIYDNYTDDLPEKTYSGTGDSFTDFGEALAANGNDLFVSSPAELDQTSGNGVIFKYDVTSGSDQPIGSFVDPISQGAQNDQFGYFLSSDGSHVFAYANVDGNGEVAAMDGNGSLIQAYQGLPGDSFFGSAMAPYNDPNAGDTIFLTSPNDNTVRQYDLAGNVLKTYQLPVPTDVPFGAVASSLAISNGKLLAGSPSTFEPDGPDSVYQFGACYVFDIASGNMDATIENPHHTDEVFDNLNDLNDGFGSLSAGLPNGRFLVTSPWGNNQNGIDAGTAYVFAPEATPPANQPPVADAGAAQTGNEGSPVNFDGSGSTDPDGTGDIVSYQWDFNYDGNTFNADASGATASHTYADNGVYTVALRVTDSAGNSSIATTTATIDNVAPTAGITGAPSIHILPGTLVSLGSTVTDPGVNDTFTYAWTVTKNNQPFASGTSSSISFTPDAAATYAVTLVATDNDGAASAPATATVTAIASSVSGVVWNDTNNDGQVNLGETGISGVTVHLTGTDDLGNAVAKTLVTDADGAFVFLNLRPGTYSLSDDQPSGYTAGLEALGTAGGSIVSNGFNGIVLGEDQDGFNYNFGEQIQQTPVVSGQAAQVGFWQNKRGQTLITSLNGGANSTALGNWLATNFPHMFGASAGADNLTGKTNSYVASFYQQQFKLKGLKLDANVLATALSVYVTDSNLAGSAGTSYGFIVDSAGLGADTYNVGSNGAAFGVANGTTLRIIDLLDATDAQSVNGVLYGSSSALRQMANNVYDAINAAGNIA